MAKKKQIELTIEEKLQNALVSKEEQPYKIPNNWCWTYVSNVMNIVMGQSPKGVDTTQNVSDIPLIGGASDMGDLYPRVNKYTKKATKLSKEDDIILSIRATLGRPIFSDGVYCLGRGVAGISSNYLSKEFIRYYYICFESSLYSNATGTTFLQVTGSVLNKMLIPLPPLNEQQRIVNRIESLFAKLDRAKELIENTLAQFEQNKMAILHKAFTGELTAKWRKKQKIIKKNTWQLVNIKTVSNKIFAGGDVPKDNMSIEKTDEFKVPIYTNGEKNNGLYGYTNEIKVKDDAITISARGTIGYTVIRKAPFYPAIRLITIIPNIEKINIGFLYYVFNFFKVDSAGSSIPQLTVPMVKDYNFELPTIEEQQEIVNILDRLLAKYNKIKNLEQQLEKIELLKKAILAKAFRGELGTNNPDEESAENLLKEILAEK
ncbi:restriction endonuclease subunit S [Megamonas funiformis]|uniref:restriction endonuclease subunit S n=1 Tax=Megamonas funiformis TaxID=437897 RepID=UPI003566524F